MPSSGLAQTDPGTPSPPGHRNYFLALPKLLGVWTTQDRAWDRNAIYLFTIEVPEGSREPLDRLQIEQWEGTRFIRFDLEDSFAFEGTRSNRQGVFSLGSITVDKDQRSLMVTFDPPVPPGKTVTLGLRPIANPPDGIYLYRVTAYPPGEQAEGYRMGFGRLHFYENDDLLRGGHGWF